MSAWMIGLISILLSISYLHNKINNTNVNKCMSPWGIQKIVNYLSGIQIHQHQFHLQICFIINIMYKICFHIKKSSMVNFVSILLAIYLI